MCLETENLQGTNTVKDMLIFFFFFFYICMPDILYYCTINILWPSNPIWWHGPWSTLAQVMACCLTAPSHYLNQCWLLIIEIRWQSPGGNFINYLTELENYLSKISIKFLRGQWVNTTMPWRPAMSLPEPPAGMRTVTGDNLITAVEIKYCCTLEPIIHSMRFQNHWWMPSYWIIAEVDSGGRVSTSLFRS